MSKRPDYAAATALPLITEKAAHEWLRIHRMDPSASVPKKILLERRDVAPPRGTGWC